MVKDILAAEAEAFSITVDDEDEVLSIVPDVVVNERSCVLCEPIGLTRFHVTYDSSIVLAITLRLNLGLLGLKSNSKHK